MKATRRLRVLPGWFYTQRNQHLSSFIALQIGYNS